MFEFLGEYKELAILGAYSLSHVVQYLPVKVTTKIPNVAMMVLNIVAAKHNANKSAETDIKGNPFK